MLRRIPYSPTLTFSESFNATTSLVNCGVHQSQYPRAQTCIVMAYPVGAGELAVNTVWTLTGSADNTGLRFTLEDNTGAPSITFQGHSTTASRPARTSANGTVTYSAWNFMASTWTAGIAATTIQLYNGINGAAPTELAYGTTIDGSGTTLGGSSNNFIIGNRGDAGRTFNGIIAYVARWKRALNLSEISRVQQQGPLSCLSDLVLCYANGRDYGPYGIRPVIKTAVTNRAAPNIYAPLGPESARRVYFEAEAGAGGVMVNPLSGRGGAAAWPLAA